MVKSFITVSASLHRWLRVHMCMYVCVSTLCSTKELSLLRTQCSRINKRTGNFHQKCAIERRWGERPGCLHCPLRACVRLLKYSGRWEAGRSRDFGWIFVASSSPSSSSSSSWPSIGHPLAFIPWTNKSPSAFCPQAWMTFYEAHKPISTKNSPHLGGEMSQYFSIRWVSL